MIPRTNETHVITFSFATVVQKIQFQVFILKLSVGASTCDTETEACVSFQEGCYRACTASLLGSPNTDHPYQDFSAS
eukprot:10045677-Ditylum_brightwellii.AAC.1